MSTLFPEQSGADFSPCQRYRYKLWRKWGNGDLVNFLMLNPSTADAVQNDPTVERCERRARQLGFDGLIVTNLFAFRATDPRTLKAAPDPIGFPRDYILVGSKSKRVALIGNSVSPVIAQRMVEANYAAAPVCV